MSSGGGGLHNLFSHKSVKGGWGWGGWGGGEGDSQSGSGSFTSH